MSTILQDVISAVKNAVPFYPVYTGLVADLAAMPYLVVSPQGTSCDYTTGDNYVQKFTFLISIFGTSLATAEVIAQTIDLSLQKQPSKFSAKCFDCDKVNYTVAPVQAEYKVVAYGVGLSYQISYNRSLSTG